MREQQLKRIMKHSDRQENKDDLFFIKLLASLVC